jgi:hypothetical protein
MINVGNPALEFIVHRSIFPSPRSRPTNFTASMAWRAQAQPYPASDPARNEFSKAAS